MRRLLALMSSLTAVCLLVAGCGGDPSPDRAPPEPDEFSYSAADDRRAFVRSCAERTKDAKFCGKLLACFERHVPIDEFRRFGPDAIANGAANIDTAALGAEAEFCISDAFASNPEATGGYDNAATKKSFLSGCADEAGHDADGKELCARAYACLEEKVPFADFYALTQAELKGEKLAPNIEAKIAACFEDVAAN